MVLLLAEFSLSNAMLSDSRLKNVQELNHELNPDYTLAIDAHQSESKDTA